MDQVLKNILADYVNRCQHNKVLIYFPREEGLCSPMVNMHFHDYNEMFIQISGETQFFFPKQEILVREGEMLVIPIGLPHFEKGFHGKIPFENICFGESGSSYQIHFAHLLDGGRPSIRQAFKFRHSFDQSARNIFQQCFVMRRYKHTTQILQQLIAATLACFMAGEPISSQQNNKEEGSLVVRCHELLRARFNMPDCQVYSLAKELGCSPNHLSSKYKQETGIALNKSIYQMRMDSAKSMLLEKRFNIRQISGSCGFVDVSHFVRRFREHYGMSPKKFSLHLQGSV